MQNTLPKTIYRKEKNRYGQYATEDEYKVDGVDFSLVLRRLLVLLVVVLL